MDTFHSILKRILDHEWQGTPEEFGELLEVAERLPLCGDVYPLDYRLRWNEERLTARRRIWKMSPGRALLRALRCTG